MIATIDFKFKVGDLVKIGSSKRPGTILCSLYTEDAKEKKIFYTVRKGKYMMHYVQDQLSLFTQESEG